VLGERTSPGKRQDWNNGSKLPLTLKQIYEADNTQEQSLSALSEFEAVSRGDKFPSIGWSWHNNWEHITPFFAFSKPARKLIYM